ncbi:MAG: hypothetical protein CVU56_24835 [Deltaproteobacteria bacterium HGW-Deltaproteobacteria-14]|jgi:fatty acid/phospholipid biosynthesis enzyme|nr:MAG: hypothetical protein CVU56_24835 [Deltaproteobacteria bacterium HGW-Deltaproteobacteria-14]
MRTALLLIVTLLAFTPACGKGSAAGGGDSSFAKRKASIEAYMTAVEKAGADGAIAAGQAWIDANKADYVANCKVLVKDRQDLEKSKAAKASPTPLDEYMARLDTVAGFDPKAPDMEKMKAGGELKAQLNTFFLCDTVLKGQ